MDRADYKSDASGHRARAKCPVGAHPAQSDVMDSRGLAKYRAVVRQSDAMDNRETARYQVADHRVQSDGRDIPAMAIFAAAARQARLDVSAHQPIVG
jgi:hypothetical protein